MEDWLKNLCTDTISKINNESKLSCYLESGYDIPNVYKGTEDIKLIILGQDPTVKNSIQRGKVTMVLNLDKQGSLRHYILEICNKLGINLDRNIYATNLIKNFFIDTPTNLQRINEEPIIEEYSKYWIEVMKEEIKYYPDIPILILGEPLLKVLVNIGQDSFLRDYWGYSSEWKNNKFNNLNYITPNNNKLNRVIIPFSHQPSASKEFYKKQFGNYCNYINQQKIIR